MLRYEQGVASHTGCVRKVNQDAWLARPEQGLWLVADGMGGHARGEWASAQIVASVADGVRAEDLREASAELTAAIEHANQRLLAAARADGASIGSTVGALLVRGGRGAVLWAGDSRVYRYRAGSLSLLTRDHSQVEQLVAAGLISQAEAAGHPMGHVLTRAVGVRDTVMLDRVEIDVLPDDIFLLCSDGLTRPVADVEIARWLGRERPERAATALLDLVLSRGAPDNVTLIVLGCDAATQVKA
ncbi:protein phosphatase 2C domain-containing protein [Sphingomonas sp. H39-1-10]|uniref:PP2C family protein-serine/threonine phosphatase n=1 Tax=Sphingomonas pollutisoli TaxID=3030829 RepID=UPI0023B9FD2D|nr:protein phosphatase 2C domain-containing protein [Sphingomonas pollutisoli]MDF0487864.1 protein phosphatase 2C domain-containing protein [Sphingomonas pollutisoli]